MIIRHTIPATPADTGRSSAASSPAQDEGHFSAELKKQMSPGQTQKVAAKPATAEQGKKPAHKKDEPVDSASTQTPAQTATDPLTAAVKPQVLPAGITTADE